MTDEKTPTESEQIDAVGKAIGDLAKTEGAKALSSGTFWKILLAIVATSGIQTGTSIFTRPAPADTAPVITEVASLRAQFHAHEGEQTRQMNEIQKAITTLTVEQTNTTKSLDRLTGLLDTVVGNRRSEASHAGVSSPDAPDRFD